MSLRVAAAAPFLQAGTTTLERSAFVVALTLDRDWFTPEEAERLVTLATEAGVLEDRGEELALAVDPSTVAVPEDFTPDGSVLRSRSVFERALERFTDAGHDKREAVGTINAVQAELAVTADAAAVVAARREGLSVGDLAADARAAIRDGEAADGG